MRPARRYDGVVSRDTKHTRRRRKFQRLELLLHLSIVHAVYVHFWAVRRTLAPRAFKPFGLAIHVAPLNLLFYCEAIRKDPPARAQGKQCCPRPPNYPLYAPHLSHPAARK